MRALYKRSQWQVARDPAEHDRRSIYLVAKRNLRLPMLEVFDAPSLTTSCPRRRPAPTRQGARIAQRPAGQRPRGGLRPRLRRHQATRQTSPPRWPCDRPNPHVARRSPRAGVPPRRIARGIHPGAVQPQWVPLCPLTNSLRMPRALARTTPTRTRHEFLRDGCCGFGGLVSPRCPGAALAAAASPLGRPAPASSGQGGSVIFLYMAGGPSHLETFDPKPLFNRLHGQRRPKEFGEAKYQFVQRMSDYWARGGRSASTARAASTSRTCSLTPAARCVRRPCRDPVVPRRHGGALGRAVRAVHRPGHARLAEHGLLGSAMAWGRRASRCRPTW